MMVRTSKPSEERKAEIIQAAAELFSSKGYSATTINDVLAHVGIAKGTFYHHFGSKEALLDALIEAQIQHTIHTARSIVERDDLTAVEKIVQFWGGQQRDAAEDGLTTHIEEAFDETAHLRLLSRLVIALTPELAPIVEQGVTEGSFTTPYPTEAIELILASSSYLFDSGLLHGPDDDIGRAFVAHIHHVERILGAEPGTLSGFLELMG